MTTLTRAAGSTTRRGVSANAGPGDATNGPSSGMGPRMRKRRGFLPLAHERMARLRL